MFSRRELNLEGGVGIEKSIPRAGGGGGELNYQLLDPDAATFASQNKL